MADLICKPSIIPPVSDPSEPPIAADWFPGIQLGALRLELRVDDNVTPQRFRAAVVAAMITVGNDLAPWRAEQEAAGLASLEDVSAAEIAGENQLAFLYRRAVGCFAKAELIERRRDNDLTGAGQREVDELGAAIGEQRRDGLHAIRDILGRRRTTVELI